MIRLNKYKIVILFVCLILINKYLEGLLVFLMDVKRGNFNYMYEEYYFNKINILKECFLLFNLFVSIKIYLNIILFDVIFEIDKFILYGLKIYKIVGLDIYDFLKIYRFY